MTDPRRHLRYWAKTDRDGRDHYHPVVHHGLDVAAVGEVLLTRRPRSQRRLAAASGLAPEAVVQLVAFLLSLHDVGKVADGFQCLSPQWMERLQGTVRQQTYGGIWRHDTAGYVALQRLLGRDGLCGLLADPTSSVASLFAKTWLAAAMGHHGVPPTLDAQKHNYGLPRQFPPAAETYVAATTAELKHLHHPGVLNADLVDGAARLASSSWLFAGLAVAADWIGSNEGWFPFDAEPCEPDTYYASHALPRAHVAVEKAGLVERSASVSLTFAQLWPEFQPTPLQRLADVLELAEGPQLVVIEEVTGGGKTEAAFTLAHRLIAGGKADGLYVGLPTMATANAMYDRLEADYRRLFAPNQEPSLILAHSRRKLRLALDAAAEQPRVPSETDTAAAQCSAWLASSSKKALLADVGIGTVDQALFAILQTRHQSLRLWGLDGKVLVVDEVHAADSYMQSLLCGLLRAHAANGGSALLLSATLSARQRANLAAAFASGAGFEAPDLTDPRYPALVHLTRRGGVVHPLEARPEASREIAVQLLHGEPEVEAVLAATLDAGGCACWIRNTVADAVAAWEHWSQRLGRDRVTLFHARFTADDRDALERDVVTRFGPKSGPSERAGRLVIATQVVEQSLDLDFDTLVSDLAMADLLVQRAGRYRRHARDRLGRCIKGTDERGAPVFHVFSPEPTDDCGAGWFADVFPGGAWVYPDHGALWLGARWLAERGRLRVPEDLRELIEHVYGDESFDLIPPALQAASEKADGRRRADASVARFNQLEFQQGYRPEGAVSSWRDDVSTPTRLGEPTTTLRLARIVEGALRPWNEGGAYAWERSEVTVRRYLACSESPDDRQLLDAEKARMPDEGRYVVVVALRRTTDEIWTGHALDERSSPATLAYDGIRGLRVERSR